MTEQAKAWLERARSLFSDYRRTGDPETAASSIELFRRAVDAASADGVMRAECLCFLGQALKIRFQASQQPEDIDSAIDAYRQAVELSTGDAALRADALSGVGNALVARFTHTGRAADLDDGIHMLTAAAEIVPPGATGREGIFFGLGLALRQRYASTQQLRDANGAFRAFQEAVRCAGADHPYRPLFETALHEAASTRQTHYASFPAREEEDYPWTDPSHAIHDGDLSDASNDQIIATLRARTGPTRSDSPHEPIALSVLGDALIRRFQRHGDIDDLEEAVAVHRAAVRSTPPGEPERVRRLTGLGVALGNRFTQTRQTEAIDEAVAVLREAVELTSPSDPNRAARLSNLGIALALRYERDPHPEDLDDSIAAHREAVRETPTDDPNRGGRMSNLGNTLEQKFDRDRALGDLDAAIAAHRQALQAMPWSDRAGASANLGGALMHLYRATGLADELTDAIANLRQAVELESYEPDRARHLYELGVALADKTHIVAAPDRRQEAITCFRNAWASTTATAWMRAAAAAQWGWLAASDGQISVAVEGLANAVSLLGEVAWRGLRRDDQEDVLRRFDGVGRDAAALAVRVDRAQYAVELLEQGRGVLLTQTVDARTDFETLRQRAPQLAEQLAEITEGLENRTQVAARPGAATHLGSSAAEEAQRRNDLARQRDLVLAEIRRIDGFTRFLLPPAFATLQAATLNGPVIIINTSRYRCDALIVSAGGVHVCALPTLTMSDIEDYVDKLVGGFSRRSARTDSQRDLGRSSFDDFLGSMLGWLWETITEPVLESLRLTSRPRPGEQWPRVWWCPTGLLAFLPLHAAGYHRTRTSTTPATVMDRVVSSYTPTLRALLHAQRLAPAARQDGPLVVAIPNTAGQPELPGVDREVRDMRARFPDALCLVGSDATRQAVLDALPHRPWLHVACHGTQDVHNPGNGQLLLHDQPLMIREISALRLESGELAFLSACQTARGGLTIADEAVTLSAGLQLAGFRHVIGTLWNIADSHAPEVANDVYAMIDTTQPGEVDTHTTAHALHAAVHNLRDRHPDDPIIWAPYVHTGP